MLMIQCLKCGRIFTIREDDSDQELCECLGDGGLFSTLHDDRDRDALAEYGIKPDVEE